MMFRRIGLAISILVEPNVVEFVFLLFWDPIAIEVFN